MGKKIWSKEKIQKYEKYHTLITILIIASVILMFIVPSFIFLAIFLGMLKKYIKQQKEQRELLDKENKLLKQGYKKICKDFFVNDKEHKLNILDITYGFSQIIDCELIEDGTSILQTIRKTKENIIRAKTTYTTAQFEICTGLVVNITTNNFENPRIIFDCKYGKNIQKNSKLYREALNNAQNIISILKIVIAQNNEKYIETGTVTKIEHRYITEETVQDQIKNLSELYKDGVLTEYEYSIKKQELLEKIK